MWELIEPTWAVAQGFDVAAVLDPLTPDQFEEWIENYPAWAPLIAIAFAIFVSMTPLPMETIAIVNGMWFGPVLGSLLTWVGAMIAAMLAFFLAKLIGYPLIKRLMPDRTFQRMEDAVNHHGAPTLIMVRMIPLIPFTVINYGAGVTTVSWCTFFWTSALGMLPPTILWVALGDMMRTQPGLAFTILFALAFFSFFAVRVMRRRWDTSHAASSD